MLAPAPNWRLLRRPRWIAAHALVLVAVVGFASLGLWQLRRLDERRAFNRSVAEQLTRPAVPLDQLGAHDDEYRPVEVTGSFLVQDELLLAGRTHRGQPGHHVLTPLRSADGRVVIVDRGWVPYAVERAPVEAAAPPRGQVRVTGLARRSSAGAQPNPDGFIARVDLPAIGRHLGTHVGDAWIQLVAQEPAQDTEFPVPAEPPALTEGNHLSYAIQWFLFAAIAAGGYPLLLRRVVRETI